MAEEMKTCPNKNGNDDRCTCPHSGCSRHGVCCECIAYHLPNKQLPQCYVKSGF